jgi:exodeoxyribonuclease VII large subunit
LSEGRRVLTVKELTKFIKMKLDGDPLLQDVWVQGEISNFTRHTSGHMYFTLKDKESRIKCIMFASYNRHLAFMPREGARVLARGNVSVYERDGQYQLYVTEMQPDGIGSLYLAFEQLKQRLEAEGLFRRERKRPIPRFPRAIGVITSPTGAAVRDIIITLQRRHPSMPVLLYPVLVQGKQAAPSIARAIEEMNRLGEVDVLIVGRGGGSLEELWAFNEEIVARSIAASNIPVISAVGHETDVTIADFVADLRAPTPTAAAELAVPHHLELRQQIEYNRERMRRGLLKRLELLREKLGRLERSPVFRQPQRYLLQPAERLDRMRDRLVHALRRQLQARRQSQLRLERMLYANSPRERWMLAKKRAETAQRSLVLTIRGIADRHRMRYQAQLRQLDALSPLKVMQRGYSLVYDEHERTLIKSVNQLQPGDLVRVRLADGRLDCQVWAMKGEEADGGNATEF